VLAGIQTLKTLGSESRAVQQWSDLFVDELNVSIKRSNLEAIVGSIAHTIRRGSPLVVLGYGGHLVMAGEMSLGIMLALSALASGFLVPVATLVQTGSQLQLLGGYVTRLDDVLSCPREQASIGRPAPSLRGRVAVDDLSFRYGPMSPLVLQEVSFEISPGELVAIVGPSGAGKSTIAALLAGLYHPTGGRVLYDGVDCAELDLRSLRTQLGVVNQSTHLFAGTIRDNIALSDPRASAPDIIRAAKLAHIHADISAMPLGYETRLSDQGGSLSGGQRQRLALARALLRAPAVLILDEATSALDAVNESKVHGALAAIECTRIVIAHRLSTIVGADRILVMHQGRVVEHGSHQALLGRGGAYAALVAAQMNGGAS
jgi:ATP-binding cassette, subfamily B, bacterial